MFIVGISILIILMFCIKYEKNFLNKKKDAFYLIKDDFLNHLKNKLF